MSKGCLFRYRARAPIGHHLKFSRSSKVVRRRISLESKRSLIGKHSIKVEFWKRKSLLFGFQPYSLVGFKGASELFEDIPKEEEVWVLGVEVFCSLPFSGTNWCPRDPFFKVKLT